MLTRPIADLKDTYPKWEIDVRTRYPEIFANSPHLTVLSDDNAEYIETTYKPLHEFTWRGEHMVDIIRWDLEEKLGVPISSGGLRPQIWLSEDEQNSPNRVQVEFGYRGKFWLLNAGYKANIPLKHYPYYQDVADILNKRCSLKLVQIGHNDDFHVPLEGPNVLSLVGSLSLRELICLAARADGIISPISFPMVLAAAYEAPCVVVAGGREPIRYQCYPNHRFLTMVGSMSCAAWDGCWKSKVEDCAQMVDGYPKCYRMLKPEWVADAVLSYYEGGRLNWGPRK